MSAREPIKAGDLVVVIYGECEHSRRNSVSRIETVVAVTAAEEHVRCPECSLRVRGPIALFKEASGHRWGVPTRWVVKIEPPGTPQSTEHEEKLTA